MMYPEVESLLEQVDSKFTLVSLAAHRAREINAYHNQLGNALGTVVPPQVHSLARKPLSIAFEEIAAQKIGFERYDPEEEEQAALDASQFDAAEAFAVFGEPALEVLQGNPDPDGGDVGA